jgi:hypothetical protein
MVEGLRRGRRPSPSGVRKILENVAESHLSSARFVKRFALNITNLSFSENILSLSDVNKHKPF